MGWAEDPNAPRRLAKECEHSKYGRFYHTGPFMAGIAAKEARYDKIYRILLAWPESSCSLAQLVRAKRTKWWTPAPDPGQIFRRGRKEQSWFQTGVQAQTPLLLPSRSGSGRRSASPGVWPTALDRRRCCDALMSMLLIRLSMRRAVSTGADASSPSGIALRQTWVMTSRRHTS